MLFKTPKAEEIEVKPKGDETKGTSIEEQIKENKEINEQMGKAIATTTTSGEVGKEITEILNEVYKKESTDVRTMDELKILAADNDNSMFVQGLSGEALNDLSAINEAIRNMAKAKDHNYSKVVMVSEALEDSKYANIVTEFLAKENIQVIATPEEFRKIFVTEAE